MSVQLLLGVILAVAVASGLWVVYDVLFKNRQLGRTAKVIWIVCAMLFFHITAITYFVLEKLD
jgi:hypothetical protein